MFINSNGNLIHASKSTPCPHCGKPDWCYFIGELSVCKRGNPPAMGWQSTGKTDKDNSPYYAPISEKKSPRERQVRFWEYPARDGSPLVRVRREDDGNGNKKITQQHWDASEQTWKSGLGNVTRDQIPVYKYADIQAAIFQGQTIFICEGEPCADALRALGLAATTNIGGSGKFLSSDAEDLSGASVVIVPDRDKPGVKHSEAIAKFFPDALWLYPFPDSPQWEKLPDSAGLDIADWISDYKLGVDEILAAVGEKRVPEKPASEESNLKLAIKAYLSEEDTFKQVQLKGEICSSYRITKSDFDALVGALTASQTSQPTKYYSGEDFLFLESEGLEWLFPGISPARGLTLLYGMPGSGKTTLALDAIAAFLNGEEFLGEKSALRGNALIVAGDELPTYTQDKAVNRGFPINSQWGVLTDWDVSKWSVLEKKIEDLRPKFVLIDSLTSIHLCDPNFDENSSKAAKTIRRLEILCQKYNLSIWLIHHSTKDGEKRGVAAARGSTAITGAASTCINIIHNGGSDDTVRTLRLDKVRGAKNRKFKIKLDIEGHWEVLPEENESEEELDLPLTDRIIALMQYGDRLEVPEICELLGEPQDNFGKGKIRKILSRLREKGLCDRRPSRQNLKSQVWYWKSETRDIMRDMRDNSSLQMRCLASEKHPQTHTQYGVDGIMRDTSSIRGGGSPPPAKKVETPLPPPVSQSVSHNSSNPIPSMELRSIETCETIAQKSESVSHPEFSEEDICETTEFLENCDWDGLEILRGSIPKNLLHLGAARLPKNRQAELRNWIEASTLAEKLVSLLENEPPSALKDFLSETPVEKITAAQERLHITHPDYCREIALLAARMAGVNERKLSIEPGEQLALEIDIPSTDDGWTQRGH